MTHERTTRLLLAGAAASLLSIAVAARAEAPDIGFARAEAIALSQVPGEIREMARKNKQGRRVFEVEVRSARQGEFEILIDALDGSVLQVKRDD